MCGLLAGRAHTEIVTMREQSDNAEYKEAFALFDKKGTGAVPRETLGDLLRALGQNPTQAEVADIVNGAPRDGMYQTRAIHDVDVLTCLPTTQSTTRPSSRSLIDLTDSSLRVLQVCYMKFCRKH